jgi:GLPGLI family protein
MTVQISYSYYEGGKLTTENGIRKLMATDTYTKAWTDKSDRNLISVTPKEAEYVSFIDSLVFNTAELNGGNKIYTSAKFTDYPIVTVTDDTTKILNYPCKKASCVINSNKIEIWFTTEMGFKGSPRMGYGLVDGMVLRVLRNGNSEILADKIEFFKDAKELMPKEFTALI